MNVIRTTMITALAAAALAGCKGKDQYADTTASAVKADTTTAAAATRTDSAAKANNGWTPATILGYATAANAGEIALGKLGEKKATSAAVKAFAKSMVTGHTAMLKEVQAVKTDAQADTSSEAAMDLAKHGQDEVKDLTDKAAGKDWDKDFMDKMIDDHQKVLDKLQDAAKNTPDAGLRASLEKATAHVQEHLTKAQDVTAQLDKK